MALYNATFSIDAMSQRYACCTRSVQMLDIPSTPGCPRRIWHLDRCVAMHNSTLTSCQQYTAEHRSTSGHLCQKSLGYGTVLAEMLLLKKVCKSLRQLHIALFFELKVLVLFDVLLRFKIIYLPFQILFILYTHCK